MDAPGLPQAVANSGVTPGKAVATLDSGTAETPATKSDGLDGEAGPDADPARWSDVAATSGDARGAFGAAAPHPVRQASVTPNTAAWILVTVGRRAWSVGSHP